MIHVLPVSVSARLRAGVAITSVTQCVEELVLNSLDAGTTCVAVRLDLPSFKVQVVDNGCGIPYDQLELVANRYSTSKCHGPEDLENLRYFGYRGEALASMREVAAILEIVSRHRLCTKSYCKLFHDGKALPTNETKLQRPSAGTTVTVHDLFNKLPVRKCTLNENLEFERVRQRLEAISLVHPNVSFSLRNDATGNKVLQTLKSNSIVGSFTHLFGAMKASCLCAVKSTRGHFIIDGFVGKDGHFNKNIQFVYINGRLVLKTRIHKLLNKLMGRCFSSRKGEFPEVQRRTFNSPSQSSSPTKQREKYGIFVLDIKCPLNEYDITFDPSKTLVEFRDWDALLSDVEKMIQDFQQQLGITVVEEKKEVDMTVDYLKGETNAGTKSDEMESSSIPSYGKCISPSLASNSLHSKVVRRLGLAATKNSENTADVSDSDNLEHSQNDSEMVCNSQDDVDSMKEAVMQSAKCEISRLSYDQENGSMTGRHIGISKETSTEEQETVCEDPLLSPSTSRYKIRPSSAGMEEREDETVPEDPLVSICVSKHKKIGFNTSNRYTTSIKEAETVPEDPIVSSCISKHKIRSNTVNRYTKSMEDETVPEDPLVSICVSKYKKIRFNTSNRYTTSIKEAETVPEDPLVSSCITKHKIRPNTGNRSLVEEDDETVPELGPLESPLISKHKIRPNMVNRTKSMEDETLPEDPLVSTVMSKHKTTFNVSNKDTMPIEENMEEEDSTMPEDPLSTPSFAERRASYNRYVRFMDEQTDTDDSDNDLELQSKNGDQSPDGIQPIISTVTRESFRSLFKQPTPSCLGGSFPEYTPNISAKRSSRRVDLKLEQLRACIRRPAQETKTGCSSETCLMLKSLENLRKLISRDPADSVMKPIDKTPGAEIDERAPPLDEEGCAVGANTGSESQLQAAEKHEHIVTHDSTTVQEAGCGSEEINVAMPHRKRSAENKTTTAAKLARLAGIMKSGDLNTNSYSSQPAVCTVSSNQLTAEESSEKASEPDVDGSKTFGVKDSPGQSVTDSPRSNMDCSTNEYSNTAGKVCEMNRSRAAKPSVDMMQFSKRKQDHVDKLPVKFPELTETPTTVRRFLTTESMVDTFHPGWEGSSIGVRSGQLTGVVSPPRNQTDILRSSFAPGHQSKGKEEVDGHCNIAQFSVSFTSPEGDIRLSPIPHSTSEASAIFKNYQSADQTPLLSPFMLNELSNMHEGGRVEDLGSTLSNESCAGELSCHENLKSTLNLGQAMDFQFVSQEFSYHSSHGVGGDASKLLAESQGFEIQTPHLELYSSAKESQSELSLDLATNKTNLCAINLSTNLDEKKPDHDNSRYLQVESGTIPPDKDLVDMLPRRSSCPGEDGRGAAITPASLEIINLCSPCHVGSSSEPKPSLHSQTEYTSRVAGMCKNTDIRKMAKKCTKHDGSMQCDHGDGVPQFPEKDRSLAVHGKDRTSLSGSSNVMVDEELHVNQSEPSAISQMWSPDVDSALLTVSCSGTVDCANTSDDNRNVHVVPSSALAAPEDESVDVAAGGSERSHEMIAMKDHKSGKKIYIHPITGHSMDEAAWELWKRQTTEANQGEVHSQKKQQLLSHDLAHILVKPKSVETETTDSAGRTAATDQLLGELWEDHMNEQSTEDTIKWRNPDCKTPDEDSSRTVDSLADLFEDWDNPVFSLPEQDVVSAELSSVKSSAVRVHKALHPCRFFKSMLTSAQVIGQVDEKFIACLMSNDENKTGMSAAPNLVVMVDQHAAHERVRLEQLTDDAHLIGSDRKKSIKRSEVTPPMELILTEEVVRMMTAYKGKFEDIGIDFSVVEGRRDAVVIKSAPACFMEREANERKRGRGSVITDMMEMLIKEQVDVLTNTHGVLGSLPTAIHKLLCSQACHGAIKFGDSLSLADCTDLVQSLSLCSLPFQCAHGRPAIMPLLDLDYFRSKFPKKNVKKPRLWKLRRNVEESELSETNLDD